jgi:hypothetical protein
MFDDMLISISDLQLYILGVTAVVVILLLIRRHLVCKYWRKPENNRRFHLTHFEGDDRRRCKTCSRRDDCDQITGTACNDVHEEKITFAPRK